MYKETITYEDYNGVERTEDHYFHMNKAEVIRWITTNGEYTLDQVIRQDTMKGNGKAIIEAFEDLIHRSYGRKSLDGKRFEKSEEIFKEFYETEAYSEFFMGIVTDAKKAAKFFNGVIPKSLADEAERLMKENPDSIPEEYKAILAKEQG